MLAVGRLTGCVPPQFSKLTPEGASNGRDAETAACVRRASAGADRKAGVALRPSWRDEFEALGAALRQEIEPRGIVEHMYVSETASIVSEILRFRRCKAAIINAVYGAALKNLLSRELSVDYQTAEQLAQGWFTDDASEKQVAEILRQRQLDDFAIEAEAIRSLASELEMLDRMLTSLEGRRNRTIRFIAEDRRELRQESPGWLGPVDRRGFRILARRPERPEPRLTDGNRATN